METNSTPLSNSLPRREDNSKQRVTNAGEREQNLFAKQTYTSLPSNPPTLLPSKNRVAFTLAEVFHPAEQSKRIAFTLAEVLITLGIIGVVAVLTIPGMIQNYKKLEFSTRLKRFNSTMQQAVMLYNAEHNTTTADWVLPAGGADNVERYWNTYYAPYFKNVIKTKKSGIYFYVYFADGSNLQMYKGGVCVDALLDLNGNKGPNKRARDSYYFLSCSGGNFSPFTWLEWTTISDTNKRLPEGVTPVTSNFNDRDNVLRLCKYSSTNFCGRLLLLDGWEFKDDYPYKL